MCINIVKANMTKGKTVIIPENVTENSIEEFLQTCPEFFQAEIVKTNQGIGIAYVLTGRWEHDPMLSEMGEFLGDSIHPEITTRVKIL